MFKRKQPAGPDLVRPHRTGSVARSGRDRPSGHSAADWPLQNRSRRGWGRACAEVHCPDRRTEGCWFSWPQIRSTLKDFGRIGRQTEAGPSLRGCSDKSIAEKRWVAGPLVFFDWSSRCGGPHRANALMQVRTAEINGELRDRLRGTIRQPEANVRPLFNRNRPSCTPPNPRNYRSNVTLFSVPAPSYRMIPNLNAIRRIRTAAHARKDIATAWISRRTSGGADFCPGAKNV